jgi:transglutaminase-like putative cysteine protease
VSVYLPSESGPGAWTDLDPTNDRAPGEDYVTLAIGRDFADVSPIRGVIHGGAHHTLRVAGDRAPLAAARRRDPTYNRRPDFRGIP